jgi:hypothetical protein
VCENGKNAWDWTKIKAKQKSELKEENEKMYGRE